MYQSNKKYPLALQVLVLTAFMIGLFLSQRWFLDVETELDRDPQPTLTDATSSSQQRAAQVAQGKPYDRVVREVVEKIVEKKVPCDVKTEVVQIGPGDIPFNDADPPRNKLEEVLRRVVTGPRKEVLVVISNSGLWWGGSGPLKTWMDCVLAAGVSNYLLVALDKEVADAFERNGWNYHFRPTRPPKVQEGTGDNHAYSAAKFGILKEFLELGYAPFLSDVDVCVIQNPFDHIYRDSDVEAMSDGFDERTAYGFIDGFDDPSMGWARYAQAFKHFNFNSGLFYLRATTRTVDLMTRLEDRLNRQKYWDQTAFNEEIFMISHGGYKSPQVTVRVLDIYKFQNSKVTFKFWRNLADGDPKKIKPVLIHINYHPDKNERVRAVYEKFHRGNEGALARFPGGSEPGS